MSARTPDSNGSGGGTPGRPGFRQDSPRSVFAGTTQPGYGTRPGSDGTVPPRIRPAPIASARSFQSWLDARLMTADLPWLFVLSCALVVSAILVFGMPADGPPRRKVDLTRVAPGSGDPGPTRTLPGDRP